VIDGTEPSFENIADGIYPVSRALFFYVKKAHLSAVPGIRDYMAEFTNERAWGPEGYLADKGLIPLSDAERADWAKRVEALADLVM
jgi:phosphate transport system substrate-binding protein